MTFLESSSSPVAHSSVRGSLSLSLWRLVAFSLVPVLLASGCSVNSMPPPPRNRVQNEVSIKLQDLSLPSFDLKLEPNHGYLIRLETPLLSSWGQTYLVSVDGKTLHGKSVDEIKKMILGPAFSTVELELLPVDAMPKKITFLRKTVNVKEALAKQAEYRGSFFRLTEAIDERRGMKLELSGQDDNPDVLIKANLNLELTALQAWPEPQVNVLRALALEAALQCYELGDFRNADRYMNVFGENQALAAEFRVCPHSPSLCDSLKILLAVGWPVAAHNLLQCCLKTEKMWRGSLEKREMIAALKVLLIEQQSTKSASAVATAGRLSKLLLASDYFQREQGEWLAAYYVSVGNCKEAMALYQVLVQERSKEFLPSVAATDFASLSPGADGSIFRVQPLAFDYYQLAYLQNSSGDIDSARQSLERALNLYKQRLSVDKITLVERLPQFFPRVSDINRALTKLSLGQTLTAAPSSCNVREFSRIFALPSSYRNAPSIEPSYKKVRACYQFIGEGKKDAAFGIIDELVKQYQESPPLKARSNDSQDQASTLLNLARALADRGWVEASNNLLAKLEGCLIEKDANSPVKVLVFAERVYNEQFAGDNQSGIRQGVWEKSYLKTEPNNCVKVFEDVGWSKGLRRLAVVYYFAGEPERADVLIKRALLARERDQKKDASLIASGNEGPQVEQTLLLLDAACIASKLKHFTEADKYLEDVLKRPALWVAAYGEKFAELADNYVNAGKVAQAESFLRKVQNKDYLMAQRYQGAQSPYSKQPERAKAAINYALARLLMSAGRHDEARSCCELAVKNMKDQASRELLVLAAECAEREGDYGVAAKYCYQASKAQFRNFGVGRNVYPNFDVLYLRKAIGFVDRAKSFDPKEEIDILMEFARRLQFSSRDESAKYFQRAYQLMPDADARKASLAVTLAGLRGTGYGGKSSATGDSLRLLEQAVEIALKNIQADANDLLLKLAAAEARQKNTVKAMAHARQAIARYPQQLYVPLLYRDSLLSLLVQEHKEKEAEDLLKEAAAQARQVTGAGSRAASAQLLLLFDFYIWQKKKYQALAVLDQILWLRPDAEPAPASCRYQSHCGCCGFCHEGEILAMLRSIAFSIVVRESVEPRTYFPLEACLGSDYRCLDSYQKMVVSRENVDFALLILNRILSRQRQVLKADDERLVASYSSIGYVYGLAKNYHEARKNYEEALKISRIYQPEELAVNLIGTDYLKVLSKLGAKAELRRLDNLKYSASPLEIRARTYSSNRIESKHDLARRKAIIDAIKEIGN